MNKNKNYYNHITFFVFGVLLISSITFYTHADDTKLTLFEDFDRDGISNTEEKTIGTDPKKADTDNDGYSDGVELSSGFNPLIPAPNDRIIKKDQLQKITITPSKTKNITKKISENVVAHIADAQEAGAKEITSDEFTNAVMESIDSEVKFSTLQPIDKSKINIQEIDCDDLNTKECKEKQKKIITEYLTASSYIFVSNFPDGFFNRNVEDFRTQLFSQMQSLSTSFTNFTYFENLAKNATRAKKQMYELTIPTEMLDIHIKGLSLLEYASDIYEDGDYKNASTDITPMIASLAQIQGLLQLAIEFQEDLKNRIIKYDINESAFSI